MTKRLFRTAKDIANLAPADWLLFNGLTAFFRLTGLWRYPIPASGDFETMTRMDLVYWFYKAQFPVTRAVKGSGLEEFFEDHPSHDCALPFGFSPVDELSLSAVGDLMDHPFLPNSAEVLYEQVADTIFGADLSMANLECVV